MAASRWRNSALQRSSYRPLHHDCGRRGQMEVRQRLAASFTILLLALCCTGNVGWQEPDNPPPTFTKDVAPILQKHCQTCHRPGEAAPFSMLTYEETRPWAPMIKM